MTTNETPIPIPRLWTIADAAEYLGISKRQVERLRERGAFAPAIRLGKSVRFVPEDVMRFASDLRESA